MPLLYETIYDHILHASDTDDAEHFIELFVDCLCKKYREKVKRREIIAGLLIFLKTKFGEATGYDQRLLLKRAIEQLESIDINQ